MSVSGVNGLCMWVAGECSRNNSNAIDRGRVSRIRSQKCQAMLERVLSKPTKSDPNCVTRINHRVVCRGLGVTAVPL